MSYDYSSFQIATYQSDKLSLSTAWDKNSNIASVCEDRRLCGSCLLTDSIKDPCRQWQYISGFLGVALFLAVIVVKARLRLTWHKKKKTCFQQNEFQSSGKKTSDDLFSLYKLCFI